MVDKRQLFLDNSTLIRWENSENTGLSMKIHCGLLKFSLLSAGLITNES